MRAYGSWRTRNKDNHEIEQLLGPLEELLLCELNVRCEKFGDPRQVQNRVVRQCALNQRGFTGPPLAASKSKRATPSRSVSTNSVMEVSGSSHRTTGTLLSGPFVNFVKNRSVNLAATSSLANRPHQDQLGRRIKMSDTPRPMVRAAALLTAATTALAG